MRIARPGLEAILRASGAELSRLRRSQGLSQFDLAELTGLHKNTIANVESGSCDASILSVSLMQVHLRATGVHVESEGFIVCPSSPACHDYPYPQLLVPPSVMVAVMGSCARRWRIQQGQSLKDLGEASGLHPNTIWNFEMGLVAPSTSSTYLIFRGLGIARVIGSERGLEFQ